MKESTTYQEILREGLEEGMREGMKKGALAEAKKAIRIVGEHRLGELDPRNLSLLERIEDVKRLEELMERLYEVSSWDELLGSASPRRRNGRRRPS